jgi:hypothetical protein
MCKSTRDKDNGSATLPRTVESDVLTDEEEMKAGGVSDGQLHDVRVGKYKSSHRPRMRCVKRNIDMTSGSCLNKRQYSLSKVNDEQGTIT